MDIFELNMLGHAIGFIVSLDCVEALNNCIDVGRGQYALRGEHAGMRLAACNVLAPKPLVDRDGGVYLAHHLCGARAEPAAPHAAGVRFVATNDPDPFSGRTAVSWRLR